MSGFSINKITKPLRSEATAYVTNVLSIVTSVYYQNGKLGTTTNLVKNDNTGL